MTRLDALQDALAAEHAAVFVTGYLGGQTSQSSQPTLYQALATAYDVHRARRDHLVGLVREEDAEPVAAAPSYRIPDVAGDAERIRARALRLERDCGEVYGFLVASSDAGDRRWAVDALLDTAVRELAFGGEPRRYPGR